jgi:hypothetical protein
MPKKAIKHNKKTLKELLHDKSVITGKEVIQEIKEKEERRKEFEASIEFEVRNRDFRG